ncbi:MAG: carboxypeptidase-like regulatory domain-containing protein [Bacteroidota bacterium]|nr:carboxypeptidase-like regulatory domain-containing protein [Bacteroidota bacterium]
MQKLLILLFLFPALSVSSQKIEGTVKDAEGNILPFASILVKGTPMGVTANNEGKYQLTLSPGNYTLDCRYVGYSSSQKNITVTSSDQKVNFVLAPQKLTLKEVIIKKGAEDPAYQIIRQAIKKRLFYERQVKAFEAEVYIKGMIRLNNLPQTIMGQKIPAEDRSMMGLDSSGKGIIYLTESVTKVYSQEPDKLKLEVVSTRVSGNNGLGFSFPAIISFYKNNVNVAPQVNPRGFVSPIADNALNFYNYKFLGSFFEDGNEVNVIKVIPKHNYEPLFSGIMNITENDWRIFSCHLTLTKKSALEILDTLVISQIHTPVENDIWRIKNQVIHFSFNKFGIRSEGDFVNVYSKYNLDPHFSKGFFNRIIIKYDSAVNKKPSSYWDSIRPVPLEPEEIKDYKTKDSAFAERNDSTEKNLDSLRKKQGPLKIMQVLWTGVNRTHYSYTNPYKVSFGPLLKTIQYNTVEGLAINPSLVLSKYSKALNSNVSFIADVRYGFNNRHLNPWAGLVFKNKEAFDPDKKFKRQSFFVAGGKRVSQFFKESDIDGLGNSIGTLLYGRNVMKIYENYFTKTGFTKEWESGAKFLIEGEYEDRLPLNNTTSYIWSKGWLYRITPNYPVEILSSQFQRYQAVVIHASFSFQPGQQYIQFPKYKMSLGSDYPTFTIGYSKGFKNIFGSDVDFDKWSVNVATDVNLKLAGVLKYNFTIGGFLNNHAVFAQDYQHFYGNLSVVADQYVRSFQNASYYQFSNASPFYAELHFEHHSNGLLSNKIPLLKKWNWNFVEGANALYVNPGTKYAETFIGLENIFKIIRIDLVVDYENGYKPVYTYRIGFGGLLAAPFNYQRFKKTEKIIDVW